MDDHSFATIQTNAMFRSTNAPAYFRTALLCTLIAGSLDILSAFIIYALLGKATVLQVLQAIASAALGRSAAFTGGWLTGLCGLFFHYFIAFCFSLAYVYLFAQLSFIRRFNVTCGLLYGVVVWVIMNLVVLPLSRYPAVKLTMKSTLISMLVLVCCIGLPIALITGYRSKRIVSAQQ